MRESVREALRAYASPAGPGAPGAPAASPAPGTPSSGAPITPAPTLGSASGLSAAFGDSGQFSRRDFNPLTLELPRPARGPWTPGTRSPVPRWAGHGRRRRRFSAELRRAARGGRRRGRARDERLRRADARADGARRTMRHRLRAGGYHPTLPWARRRVLLQRRRARQPRAKRPLCERLKHGDRRLRDRLRHFFDQGRVRQHRDEHRRRPRHHQLPRARPLGRVH